MDFQTDKTPLLPGAYARVGKTIGVSEDVVRAVVEVETNGRSYDSRGRLRALYEPHVAWARSSGSVRASLASIGLAYPKWKKNYPKDSYLRIERAMAVDEDVALKATSWGLPQIMGFNYEMAGYSSARAMVEDFCRGEAVQLTAMATFIRGSNLDDELQALSRISARRDVTADECRAFVRGYNGKEYAKNDYHTKLAKAINAGRRVPDHAITDEKPDVRPTPVAYDALTVQTKLKALGYHEVGMLDGKLGSRTAAAVAAFRADNKLAPGGGIDADFLATIETASPRVIAPARANTTVSDLRAEGVPEVRAADETQTVGGIVATAGAVGTVASAAEKFKEHAGVLQTVADALAPIKAFLQDNLWIALAVVGGYLVWRSGLLKRLRLAKHQSGEDLSA